MSLQTEAALPKAFDAHRRWQASRQAELLAPESWLGMTGLFWLEPGENRVGNADDCPVRLPSGPAFAGILGVEGSRVHWHPAPDSPMLSPGTERDAAGRQALKTDRDGSPDALTLGSVVLVVIERGGRLAARVRDLGWASGRQVPPLAYFPYAPEWAVDADWEVLSPPLAMEVPNATGDLIPVEVSHQAVFELAGQRIRLLPMTVNERELFFVFRDRTSGKESYGAGRFLKAKPAVNGKIRLNFNFAYNPPCAFTAFATCPLPPPENWLQLPVAAGEMKWTGAH